MQLSTIDCCFNCRLLRRPTSVYAAAGQAGLSAGRAEAAGAVLDQMPMGLRRIAGQAAQILSSHVSSHASVIPLALAVLATS